LPTTPGTPRPAPGQAGADDRPSPPAERLRLELGAPPHQVAKAVREWIDTYVPLEWRAAAHRGGPDAIRKVRSRADYEAWYPVFGRSGLVAPTWPEEYGGLGLSTTAARLVEAELKPYNLGRLNPLGLNQAACALFAYGTHEQRLRFLPPIVGNEEVWCQLFSEPGAGSDLASLATTAERDGDEWLLEGQKVWNTWAHLADWAVVLARTDPDLPKRRGITYFLLHMHQSGVEVHPLRHIGGEVDFNRVVLRDARVSDQHRVGEVGEGWRVANATLTGERQMVSGTGSGGVDRIGGRGVDHLFHLGRKSQRSNEPLVRAELARLYSEERVREWTNTRGRTTAGAGGNPGDASSVGKLHQSSLNQRIQLLATDMLGMSGLARKSDENEYGRSLPLEVRGMLRSRANTIEGGTTEINKNIIGERILGLPRDPDPWTDVAWKDTPRS